MPVPDDLKDGDALEPYHLNEVFAELRRLRKMTGALPVVVEGADSDDPPLVWFAGQDPFFIQLTGAYSSGYPWKEVVIGAGRVVQDAGVTGGPSTGDPAFERQTGDTTLTADGTVYEARWSRADGLTFDGKN